MTIKHHHTGASAPPHRSRHLPDGSKEAGAQGNVAADGQPWQETWGHKGVGKPNFNASNEPTTQRTPLRAAHSTDIYGMEGF